jgi:hypothetical protein
MINCLRNPYNVDLGEQGMMGDLTGPRGLNIESSEEEEEEDIVFVKRLEKQYDSYARSSELVVYLILWK